MLDGFAAGPVQVTVVSEATGDSETFSIAGAGPDYAGILPSSTAGGPRANDGTLLVAPSDRIRVTYNGRLRKLASSPTPTSTARAAT